MFFKTYMQASTYRQPVETIHLFELMHFTSINYGVCISTTLGYPRDQRLWIWGYSILQSSSGADINYPTPLWILYCAWRGWRKVCIGIRWCSTVADQRIYDLTIGGILEKCLRQANYHGSRDHHRSEYPILDFRMFLILIFSKNSNWESPIRWFVVDPL